MLYSESKWEEKWQAVGSVEPTWTSGNELSEQKDGASGSMVIEEEVVVEDVE